SPPSHKFESFLKPLSLLLSTPSSPNMTAPKADPVQFRILPATEEDCLDLAKIESASFSDASRDTPERNSFLIMLGPPTEEGIEFRQKNFIEKLTQDPSSKFWKVVVNEGDQGPDKVVACALWHFYTEPLVMDEWKGFPWPSTANADACDALIGGVYCNRRKHMNNKTFGFLQVLGTLREYRGCGIGSALMETGLNYGISQGLTEFWIDASADGYPLYRKFGFEDVDVVRKDLTPYGGVGNSDIVGMRKLIV
ncbi:uncharacterized protein N7459_000840, partial [Penicillium hispanicum]|uniref:uncharacterized protein n=1 Tax=Penicillium hispanicum TaxID=1080232 RepID=UPI00253F7027